VRTVATQQGGRAGMLAHQRERRRRCSRFTRTATTRALDDGIRWLYGDLWGREWCEVEEDSSSDATAAIAVLTRRRRTTFGPAMSGQPGFLYVAKQRLFSLDT
jgi:hypothetical protein